MMPGRMMGKMSKTHESGATNTEGREERVGDRWSSVPGSQWPSASALVSGWLILAASISPWAVAAPTASPHSDATSPQPASQAVAAPHEMRPEHDLRTYGVVESAPGMDRVRVESEITYKTAGGRDLRMDVYRPPDAAPAAAPLRPAVVFVNGVGDWPGSKKVREWGQYRSWPRLIAASGLAAVTFDARGGEGGENGDDVKDAFAYVREHARSLGIDPDRIAAWACSANVRSTVAFLARPDASGVKAAVLYYGAGDWPSIRADLPVLLVRAGKDNPAMNEETGRLASQAAAANAPWTVVNLPGAHHAFDVLDDTNESRMAIRRTLAFLHESLDPAPPSARPRIEAREALAHFFAREWPEAEAAYARYVIAHPEDADAWTLLGNARIELKKPEEAAASLRKAIELDPRVGEAWAMLGKIESEKKNYDEAARVLQKAIGFMPDDAESHFQLGKVYLAQHHTADAIGSLERSVQLFAGNGWAWNSLAYAYLEAKQPDKAASSFEHVLPFAPKNPTLLYNTACAYALAGDKDKALAMLDRAIAEGYKDKAGLTSDPDLLGIRSDPRFLDLVKKLG